ncbi:MAG: alpha/beta hydrolase [Alphaproteobacteria bacterium]|nr:alpha/beta hydrolase [Alphaproteobacteria bacterium]
MDKVMEVVKFFVFAYVCTCLLMYVFQRSFMYYPKNTLGSCSEAGVPDMHEVKLLTKDGLELVSWYGKAKNNRPTIAFFYGNAGNIAGVAYKARIFMDAGYGMLLVGYRGYGGNEGSPTEEGLIADAFAAADFLEKEQVEKVVYYGESLGSGVAVALAVEKAPVAIILEAPFSSALDVAKIGYWYLPTSFLMKDKFDSVARIKNVKAPLLLIHGESDKTIPVALGRKLLEAANEPKKGIFIPNAHHANLYDFGAHKKILEWLSKEFPL